MTSIPTGTVTFLFTDIEGSTRLWQEYPNQMKTNLERHDALLHAAIEGNEGYVFKTVGDAFCAAFPTAIQGVHAAIQSQKALAQETWDECIIKVRMGLHTGDAEERDNDYFGNTVNRVARLMSAGHGGQILLSLATQELVSSGLPEGVTLRDMGKHRLKDLTQPEHIYQLNVASLPSDFLPLKTLDIQLNNLPTQLTHFVGRDRETAAVLRLLRTPDVHLVTLTGPGGTGKTRLSLQVAADLLDEYEHGVWFVELASITNPELFLSTVASTLKVKEAGGKSIGDALNEYLADKQLLLALDNFEQIVSAAPQISKLLNAAPKVKVLVSSREVLRLRGEHDYPVPPLGLPESKRKQTATVLAQYEAIALFTQHARAANPSFELNEDNANIVAEICMKLDGLPLAIELAAARSRLFKPAVMLEKLKNKLNMLTGGARDLPHRQQTIRGAIDWSYDLLDEVEKKLFTRLGIFVGGWTLDSAEAVCGSGLDALNGVESLLDKSLIRQFEGTSGETRFTMLETIREYAHEKLSHSGALESIQQAHADFMEQFLQKVAAAQGESEAEGVLWNAKLDDELDNLRSVMEWALRQGKPAYVLQIGRFELYWVNRLRTREAVNWLERALAVKGGTPSSRANAMNSAGNLSMGLDEFQKARAFYEAALALWREMGDKDGIAGGLDNLGSLAWTQEKDYEKAQKLFEEALGELGDDPDSGIHTDVLNHLGSLARIRGDYSAAQDYYTRSRQICVNSGFQTKAAYVDFLLAKLALCQRKLDEAEAYFESFVSSVGWVKANRLVSRGIEGCYRGYIRLLRGNIENARKILDDATEAALEIYEQAPNLLENWIFLDAKARLELIDGCFERSAQFFGVAWIQREQNDRFLTEFERPDYEARIAELRAMMGDAAFNAAFEKGQAMSIKDALTLVVEETQ